MLPSFVSCGGNRNSDSSNRKHPQDEPVGVFSVYIVAARASGIVKIMLFTAVWTANLRNTIHTDTDDLRIRFRSCFKVRFLQAFYRIFRQKELQFSALRTAVNLHLQATAEAEIQISYPSMAVSLLEMLTHHKRHGTLAPLAMQLSFHSFSTASITPLTPSVFTVSIRPLS